MSQITHTIGSRLKSRRLEKGLTQEALAELAHLHPSYIGQVERGERNATIQSIEKSCIALDYPMESLFSHIIANQKDPDYPGLCYDLIIEQSTDNQKLIFQIVSQIYKKK